MANKPFNIVEELAKISATTATAIGEGDVKAVKRQRRLIALLFKNVSAMRSSFDKGVKTSNEVHIGMGEDTLFDASLLFRKESETGNKPGRKAKVKPTDAEMFNMILSGELDEDDSEEEEEGDSETE